MLRKVLFWTGEILACVSVFAIPYMLMLLAVGFGWAE